jgi:hypothetical protein
MLAIVVPASARAAAIACFNLNSAVWSGVEGRSG